MRKVVLLLLVVMLSIAAVPALGQESANPTPSINAIAFNDFGFAYHTSLGSTLTIAAKTGDAPDVQQPGGPVPPHTLYALYHPSADGTPVNPDFAPVLIRFYHTADLAPYAAQSAALSQLESLLADRPDLGAYTVAPSDISQAFPSLPMLDNIPAAQTIIARPAYLEASGFTGIAYITAYRSDVSPFMSDSFAYIFQGISTDGALAVSAWFDLTTPLFPETLPADFNYDAFTADYLNNLTQSVEILTSASPDDFSPSLTMLDTLISSFTDLSGG